jgi:hypothetical protein
VGNYCWTHSCCQEGAEKFPLHRPRIRPRIHSNLDPQLHRTPSIDSDTAPTRDSRLSISIPDSPSRLLLPADTMASMPAATIYPQSHVGFDSITSQIERKLLKRGFQFNVICVGPFSPSSSSPPHL